MSIRCPGLAIFDLDNTIVRGQSQRLLVKYLRQEGLLRRGATIGLLGWFIAYRLGMARDPRPPLRYAVRCLAGLSDGEVRSLIGTFVDAVIVPRVYPAARLLIDAHRGQGHELILVSNAVRPLAAAIAERLGILHVCATDLEVKNGVYTGELVGDVLYGPAKCSALHDLRVDLRLSEPREIWAYADHWSDLTLLRLASHPVVVNGDRRLRRHARRAIWPMVDFD